MSEKETVKEIIYKVIVSETITKEISDIKKMCKYFHSDIQRLNIEVDTIKEDRLEALETAVNQLIGEKAKNHSALDGGDTEEKHTTFKQEV